MYHRTVIIFVKFDKYFFCLKNKKLVPKDQLYSFVRNTPAYLYRKRCNRESKKRRRVEERGSGENREERVEGETETERERGRARERDREREVERDRAREVEREK